MGSFAVHFSAIARPDLNSYLSYRQPDTITIGLLVENEQKGLDAVNAAQLAITQANQSHTGSNKIFKLAIRNTDGPWGQASNKTVELIYDEKAVAVVGVLNGRTAHLAEQVTAKSHIPYLETKATDPTLSKAFVPWFFRLVPNDDQIAKAIVSDIYRERNFSTVAVISDQTYDDVRAVISFKKMISELEAANPEYFELENSEVIANLANRLNNKHYDALVVLSASITSQSIMAATEAKVYSTRQLSTNSSKVQQSELTVEIVASQAKYDLFTAQYQGYANAAPSAESVYMYDTINLLIHAINEQGTSTGVIGEYLRSLSDYEGITGRIGFDGNGNLKRATKLH